MASKLAQAAAAGAIKDVSVSKAKAFFFEVCRCMPFVHASMRLEELVSVRDMRNVVKQKFLEYKDVTDPRVIDLLVFKGREELEVYLTGHKQRHHAITEYLDEVIKERTQPPKKGIQQSAFLNSFLEGNYSIPTGK